MDITKKIKTALAYADMNQQNLADYFDTSIQNMSQRVKRGVFSVSDLEKIADACGAELEVNFTFPDGMKI